MLLRRKQLSLPICHAHTGEREVRRKRKRAASGHQALVNGYTRRGARVQLANRMEIDSPDIEMLIGKLVRQESKMSTRERERERERKR